MSRPTLRVLSALLVLSVAACASSPTAPAPNHPQLRAPGTAASFDDIIPTDTTCRSGYMNGQGKTC